MINRDTICAVSTAAGAGAIAVLRISGDEAFLIADKIFNPANNNKKISTSESHRMLFGQISDENNEPVDEVLCATFIAPHSFTGENSVEIFCHGSQYIQQQILRLLLENGCRLALPGEFTQRAFLNGKMDLSQAEAIADLIASNSAASHRLAINQMRGGFSKELSLLRMDLLDFVSLIELELDFSEEEVEFADRERLKELVYNIKSKIKNLADSFRFGNAVKNGIPVAIIGETNVGKSTLLNWLLNEEKAIVSDIHGTTRDVIEDTVQIDGILFRFIDTAGIRQTEDTIENLGIERTYKKIKEASIVLLMIDSSYVISEIKTFLDRNLPILKDKKVILLFNKKDIITHDKRNELDKLELPKGVVKLFVSAKQDRNKRDLLDALISLSEQENAVESNVIVTNMRHYEALNKSLEAIERVEEGMDLGLSGDLLSRDIRDCMHYLGEITGEISNDDILGNVFGKFCIGK